MKKNNQSAVQEVYQLPSLGKVYGEDFPSEVTIRSMTTFEEKMRLGNQGFWNTMVNILNSVVTSPEDFDAQNLTLFDFYFLMYKMRTVSYGPTYKVSVKCPTCGKEMISRVNLDELKVNYLPEDFNPNFTIGPLPRSGDTLTCKFVTVKDEMNIEKKAKSILRDHPDYQGDPTYILNKAAQIKAINGEDKLPVEVQMYVEKMDAMDSAYLSQAYTKMTDLYGLDVECHDTCEDCGEDIQFLLPFNSEFFRPTFDF